MLNGGVTAAHGNLFQGQAGVRIGERFDNLRGLFNGVIVGHRSILPNSAQGEKRPDDLKIQSRMMEHGMTDEKTVFVATHFVHTYGPIQDEMEQEFQKYGFIAAYDGIDVDI